MKKHAWLTLMILMTCVALLLSSCTTATTATTTTGATTTTAAATTTTAAQTTAAADPSLQKVLTAKKLVLGLDDAFPPMGYRNDKNEIVGFDIDLAKEVAKRMGVTLKLQPIDWDQKYNELNAGTIDCIWNGYSIDAERLEKTNITEAYMKNRQVVVVLADSPVKTLADLAGKTVAVQAASAASSAVDAKPDFKKSLKQVIELKDYVTAIMDLKAKGSDALVIDEIVAGYYIAREKAPFRILDEALASEEYGVGFRKADQSLRDEVQRQLKAMAADGTLAKISIAWFSKDITTIK
jgi:polar amino acid transport system substrate-binding protein